MNTYRSETFGVQAGQTFAVKEAGSLYYRLKIINNSDNFISILIHNPNEYTDLPTVVNLKNGILDFEDDEPKNKISLRNDGTEDISITLMWRV